MKAIYLLPTITVIGGLIYVASLNSVTQNDSPKFDVVTKATGVIDPTYSAVPKSLISAGLLLGMLLVVVSAIGYTLIVKEGKVNDPSVAETHH